MEIPVSKDDESDYGKRIKDVSGQYNSLCSLTVTFG